MIQQLRTEYHTYAGVFAIIASCILIALTAVYVFLSQSDPYYDHFPIYVMGVVINFAVNTVGLMSGTLSLLRRNFIIAVVGVSFTLLDSFWELERIAGLLWYSLMGYHSNYPITAILLFSIVATVLSFLAVVCLAKAKAEFVTSIPTS
jgi:hypothetical protein